jgi:hypothetical protein
MGETVKVEMVRDQAALERVGVEQVETWAFHPFQHTESVQQLLHEEGLSHAEFALEENSPTPPVGVNPPLKALTPAPSPCRTIGLRAKRNNAVHALKPHS